MTRDEMALRTNEELFSIYRRTQDKLIKQELTMRYVYIVKTVAFQMRDMYAGTMTQEDIVQEGVIEIMKAIDRYDQQLDNKFETFISRRIRGMVIDLVRKNDWMPRNYHKDRKSIDQAREELTRSLGHAPTDEELAEHLQVDIRKVQKVQRMETMTNVLSLDMTYEENEDALLQVASDKVSEQPEKSFFKGETVAELARAIDQLKDQEKLVISLYYVEELSMVQIADVMAVSQPRVSQLHASAIRKLKAMMQKDQ